MHLYKTEKFINLKSTIIACLVFLAVIFFCAGVTGTMSAKISVNQKETLEKAINNAIVTCYSIEGCYPENLDYIKEQYGIVIDDNKYFVDYKIIASNIKPQVTIIELNK